MSRLRIFRNPLDGVEEVLRARTNDVLNTFIDVKRQHPKARIYIQPACIQNDVTPTNKVDEASLQMLAKTHDFDIVCEAGEPATIIAVVSLVVSLAVSVYTMMNMPKTNNGLDRSSANNQLGQQKNEPRIGGRIPDIYGTVKSIPDLLSLPYRYFENSTEIEERLLCVGRGYFHLDNMKEGSTSIRQIDNMSVSAYDPGMDITTQYPKYRYGDILDYPPLIAAESQSISGQTLLNPNSNRITSDGITFSYPNAINVSTDLFEAGETIIIDGAQYGVSDETISGTANIDYENHVITIASSKNIIDPQNFKEIQISALIVTDEVNGVLDLAGQYKVSNISKTGSFVYEILLQNPSIVNQNWLQITEDNSAIMSANLIKNSGSINLDGEYVITSNSGSRILLSAPDSKNPDWLKIGDGLGGEPISLFGAQANWLGWYETDDTAEQGIFNFYAPQGLYYIGKKGWKATLTVSFELEYQRIDEKGDAVGSIVSIIDSISGVYAKLADPVAKTVKVDFGFESRVRYRMRRITFIPNNGNTNVDDLQVRSVYTGKTLKKLAYDDLTIIRIRTIANDVSAGVKDRQFNCIASKLIYTYATGDRSAERIITSNFADIVCDLTVDEYIGRRPLSELDVASLYDTSAKIANYFGTSKVCEFNGTFDQSNLSYEETLQQIASIVFCNARRANGQTFFEFERENPSSSILFNHRNKKPRSEQRTTTLIDQNQYDGVEVKWRDPGDNHADATLKIPHDDITNAKKVDAFGVMNKVQAHMLGWRVWNKLQYQKEVVQFTAYGEADLVTIGDRIAVTDDVSPSLVPMGAKLNFTSGEVVGWVGRNITVSQPISLLENHEYTIHLQLSNGSIETMSVQQGSDEHNLILERLPMLPLVTQFDRVARTVYSITLDDDRDSEAFIITEKSVGSTFLSTITAQNYDVRYWSNDKDHIKNLI